MTKQRITNHSVRPWMLVVGFCCAMCIPKWNKLSDADKDKKLAAALAKKK